MKKRKEKKDSFKRELCDSGGANNGNNYFISCRYRPLCRNVFDHDEIVSAQSPLIYMAICTPSDRS